MNREQLEAEIAKLKGVADKRQLTLMNNDPEYRDLNAQIVVHEKWLESLNGKGDGPDEGDDKDT